MTVSYTAEVATCRGLGCFLKLLLRWRASIYKLVWIDLAFFLVIYYSLSLTYRFALDKDQQRTFEDIVAYCNEYADYIPLAFVLGFYVTIVMTRWWNQYTAIPWPDSIAVFVSATIHGNDERGRLMRRTIVRYVCVCLTLVLTNVSPRVKKRFPTLDHFVDSGLLLENELAIFQSLNQKFPKPSKHWLPIVWASSIVTRARKEGRIRDDFAVKTLIDELNKFRGSCGSLIQYDNISIPLVYTQVVTLAVYSYFLSSVMAGQWVKNKLVTDKLDDNKTRFSIDLYFPFFTALRFFFYMGWLKVAETLINPFGEDDDDFEVNWLIDRNLQVSYLIVDEMHHEHPELIRDQYWDEVFPVELPYTAASEAFREEHPEPSTANIQLSAAQQEILPSSVRIDEMVPPDYQLKDIRSDIADDAASGIHFNVGKISRSTSRVSQRERNMSLGSTASNIGGSLTRIGSVTSVLKRMFSKEDRPDGSVARTPGTLPSSSSSASLQNQRQVGAGGSMRIGVIEEVDEQMTMTSMRPEHRPHVMSIFPQGPPPASAPMDVPGGKNYSHRNGQLFSSSAPAGSMRCRSGSGSSRSAHKHRPTQSARSSAIYDPSFIGDLNEDSNEDLDDNIVNLSNASSIHSSDDSADEFTKLKVEREKQRIDKVARSVESTRESTLDLGEAGESLLLAELAESSKIAMQSTNRDNKQSETGRL